MAANKINRKFKKYFELLVKTFWYSVVIKTNYSSIKVDKR